MPRVWKHHKQISGQKTRTKYQTSIKLKGQEQPKVVRNGDDETGIMGI